MKISKTKEQIQTEKNLSNIALNLPILSFFKGLKQELKEAKDNGFIFINSKRLL